MIKIRWTERPGRGHSSPIVSGNLILQTNSLVESVHAWPAIANRTSDIRGDKHLVALRRR